MGSRSRSFKCIVAGLLFLGASTNESQAKSYIESMYHVCPDGAQIRIIGKQYLEASALGDEVTFALASKLARLFYECSQSGVDRYSSDIALLYITHLQATFRTSEQQIEKDYITLAAANDLAAATRFPDIRSRALKEREMIRKFYNDAYKALNPGSESTPPPFQTP